MSRLELTEAEIKYIKFAVSADLEILENGDWTDPEDVGQRVVAKSVLEKLDEIS